MRRPVRRRAESHPSVQRATRLFLEQRLTDAEAMLWAARLTADHSAERAAVRDLILYSSNRIEEPFRSAWRYIALGWENELTDADMTAFHLQDAIVHGVDPHMLVGEIVTLVEPRIQVDASYGLRKGRHAPKKVTDLLPASLAPAHAISLADVGLAENEDPEFWAELVDQLDGALVRALHHADRLDAQWTANWVVRVYPDDGDPDNDPDRFRDGFAPIAKLYSAAVAKLIRTRPAAASQRLGQLARHSWTLTRRLWAAGARAREAVETSTIAAWLESLTDDEIWDIHEYPEFAELRALRFGELTQDQRRGFERRVRKGPPLSAYRRGVAPERKRVLQRQAATLEMRRLAASGTELSATSRAWLAAREEVEGSGDIWARFQQDRHWDGPSAPPLDVEDPDLPAKINGALTDNPYVTSREAIDAVSANWDTLFTRLQSDPRLLRHGRLIGALAVTQRDQWIGRDPASPEGQAAIQKTEAFLALVAGMPDSALLHAAQGLGHWFDVVPEPLLRTPELRQTWLRVWPYAAAETNARAAERASSEAGPEVPEEDQISSRSLNSSIGRMLSAFGQMLPRGEEAAAAFDDPQLRAMREMAATAEGEAGRQGLYRLLLLVRYLNHVDPAWTRDRLLGRLRDGSDPAMWDAISRIPLLAPDAFAEVATEQIRKVWDDRLSAPLRSRLAERIVLPVVFALERDEEPPIPLSEIEQMLRLGGTAVRTHCASSLVRVLGARTEPFAYAKLIKPIITSAWPKDSSTLSAAMADALAAMPAAAGEAFAECVEDIADLLVPFDAWSLWEYRIYERDGDERSLRPLASEAEALALLRLLDLTIGHEEQAISPRDLDTALAAIAARSKAAARTTAFARLSALTRW